MKATTVVRACCLALPSCSWLRLSRPTRAGPASPHTSDRIELRQAALHFEANQGQTDPQVRFLARGAGYSLLLTSTEAVLRLQKPAPREVETPALALHKLPLGHAKEAKAPVPRETATLRMQLIGANAHPTVTGQAALPGTVNYFRGQDPTQWRSGVSTYQRVKYAGVYAGIDLICYGQQRQLEYDFVVAHKTDPSALPWASAAPNGWKSLSRARW